MAAREEAHRFHGSHRGTKGVEVHERAWARARAARQEYQHHQLMVRGRKEVTKAAPARPEINHLIDHIPAGWCQGMSGNKADAGSKQVKAPRGTSSSAALTLEMQSPSEAGFENMRRSAGAGLKQQGGRGDSRSERDEGGQYSRARRDHIFGGIQGGKTEAVRHKRVDGAVFEDRCLGRAQSGRLRPRQHALRKGQDLQRT